MASHQSRHRLSEADILASLKKRVARWHLKQRLGIEQDHEVKVFGQGRNFFHIENWYSFHSVIRNTLRLFLLHGRGQRNARKIKLRNNTFRLANLPMALRGYTILHLSDLHLDMALDMPAVLAHAVDSLKYDICVITGDLRARTFGDINQGLDAMARLLPALKGQVYAVLGNHDSIMMVPELEQMGIKVLLNEAVEIESRGAMFYLAGIDDAHYFGADNLERASEQVDPDAVTILLSHTPEVYRHAAFTDFDIMLCGHTHGGQICLPGGYALMYNANCPRHMCRGAWRYHDLQGYTSVGSGSCVVDVRFNCPPEVTLHTLMPLE